MGSDVYFRLRIVLASLLVSWVWLPDVVTTAQRDGADARRVVVLSDLHMGDGRDTSGNWLPYEDFRWTDELELFLAALQSDSEVSTDLVLNGDVFDLVQSGDGACSYEDGDLGCSEDEVLVRLERVLAAHAREVFVGGVGFLSGGIVNALLPSSRLQNLAVQPLERPIIFHKPRGEVVQ